MSAAQMLLAGSSVSAVATALNLSTATVKRYKAILDDGGLASSDYDLKLSQTYKPEEHVCQYQESHFDFISRWMEREGMYYYFEQGDSAERLHFVERAGRFKNELIVASHFSTRYHPDEVRKLLDNKLPPELKGKMKLWV